MPSDPDIMTLEEVAHYLKVKPQTVYKWAQDGQIPGTKLSKEWRFRKAILDEWIDTSILHSKGGFDLLLKSTQKAIDRKGFTGEELNELLREAGE
jgi:excisionase family DNA binding protein